jgi:hypothetical protein
MNLTGGPFGVIFRFAVDSTRRHRKTMKKIALLLPVALLLIALPCAAQGPLSPCK